MIISATGDWFFIHPDTNNKTIILPIAAWEEKSNGLFIGLCGNVESKRDNNYVSLVPPPPVDGMYIKRNPVNSNYINSALENNHIDYNVIKNF